MGICNVTRIKHNVGIVDIEQSFPVKCSKSPRARDSLGKGSYSSVRAANEGGSSLCQWKLRISGFLAFGVGPNPSYSKP